MPELFLSLRIHFMENTSTVVIVNFLTIFFKAKSLNANFYSALINLQVFGVEFSSEKIRILETR